MNHSKTTIVGRIGKHPPTLKQAGRASYAGFSVAVNHGYGDKQTTSWYHVRLWGKAGDAFAKYAVAGQEVLIEGEHRQEKWRDKRTGEDKEMWVLHAFQGELGQKPGEGRKSSGARSGGDYGYSGESNSSGHRGAYGDTELDDTPF